MCRCGITGPSGASESILCNISQSNPKGAAHACSGNSFRGGVSPRFTHRPKGQSTVEYVLIIAIIVLVILIAGPWVSSAIGNQFNTVAGAIGSGTTGENFYEPVDIPDPENGTAFAVYSEDDQSLMFYKRRGVPQVGDMFNYRRVTEVYTGFETADYNPVNPDDLNGDMDTPWFGHANDILSVAVVDEGICPNMIWGWFQRLNKCASFDVSKLDTSAVTSFGHVFFGCLSVKSIDISSWDMSKAIDTVAMFGNSKNLTSVQFGTCDFSNVKNLAWMFAHCYSLVIDCSDWTVQNDAEHIAFAAHDPGVISPKAWH